LTRVALAASARRSRWPGPGGAAVPGGRHGCRAV